MLSSFSGSGFSFGFRITSYNVCYTKLLRVIYTFAEAAALSGEIPRDLESAEYNIRFPVAAAIVHGEFTPAQLAENHFRNDALLDILKLIETRIDPEIQNQFPQKCLSRVEISYNFV